MGVASVIRYDASICKMRFQQRSLILHEDSLFFSLTLWFCLVLRMLSFLTLLSLLQSPSSDPSTIICVFLGSFTPLLTFPLMLSSVNKTSCSEQLVSK
jgi:hypothetical protein